MKPRVYLGLNGVTQAVILEFISAFMGGTLRRPPSKLIRVKMQETFKGLHDDSILIEEIKKLEQTGASFLFRDDRNLVFYLED